MKHITAALIFIATTPAPGCDEGPPSPDDDDVALRQVDEYLVGEELVTIQDFAGIVAACDGVEEVKMTVSLTSYPLGADARVVGIGASTLATIPLYECWREIVEDKLGKK